MKSKYLGIKKITKFPLLPLEGKIDLTFRCHNSCRHCWICLPCDGEEKKEELTLEEIKFFVNEARKLGCRKWSISGGEPLIREDFPEIFDYITKNSLSYSLNTNGTFITPEIAKLMKRPGNKMISFYGATAEVHDDITGTPGSFALLMEGVSILKKEKVNFTAQPVFMNSNFQEYEEMINLAKSFSPHYRIGASWFYLSASGDEKRNKEIIRQRLSAEKVMKINVSFPRESEEKNLEKCSENAYILSECIENRRDFYIDPYGKMTFCPFIKSPELLYDLRRGSFQEGWEEFIPSLKEKVIGGEEYRQGCKDCNLKFYCYWCPAYAYLEKRRFSAKIDYLCHLAGERKKCDEDKIQNNRKYYRIADITIRVDSELPFNNNTFHEKFEKFLSHGPGEDNVSISHHFTLPHFEKKENDKEVYRKSPWAIYRRGNSWIYKGILPDTDDRCHRIAVFDNEHTRGHIYSPGRDFFLNGNIPALTFFPTDQIYIGRLLADRKGFYLHSCGVIYRGEGLVFAGHSDAGKTTVSRLLENMGEILCDDRIIVRKKDGIFNVYGTWSHGDSPLVSSASAPLKRIYFLHKSTESRVEALKDKREIIKSLLPLIIKPLTTPDWWEKTLSIAEEVCSEINFYNLYFRKDENIVETLGL